MEEPAFQIKIAKPSHVDDICKLLIRSITEVCGPDYNNDPNIIEEWLKNKTPENILEWIKLPNIGFVVLNNQKAIVGFALISIKGEILLNYILPGYLNRGIGKVLLEEMEQIMKKNNLNEITVLSTKTAKNFYEKNGFIKNGNPSYVGNILGEFPLKKILVQNLG